MSTVAMSSLGATVYTDQGPIYPDGAATGPDGPCTATLAGSGTATPAALDTEESVVTIAGGSAAVLALDLSALVSGDRVRVRVATGPGQPLFDAEYVDSQAGRPVQMIGPLTPASDAVVTVEQASALPVQITRVDSVATATTPRPHGLTEDDVVTIQGAEQADYNGAQTVVSADLTTFTFAAPGSPATPATGAIVAGVPKAMPWRLHVI